MYYLHRHQLVNTYKDALLQEKQAVKAFWKQNGFTLTDIQLNKREAGDFFYQGQVANLAFGDQISIPDGIQVRLIYDVYSHASRAFEMSSVLGTFLAYDEETTLFYFSTNDTLFQLNTMPKRIRVEPLTDVFIDIVLQKLDRVIREDCLGWEILENRISDSEIQYKAKSTIIDRLNVSQQEAINDMFRQGATLLWGPPGTGKTTTLASAIYDMLQQGKRILAVAISNVAVDQIALKLLNLNTPFAQGDVVRFGVPRLTEVLKRAILFPNKLKVQKLREQIYTLKAQLKTTQNVQEKAVLQRELNSLQAGLRNAIIEALTSAKLTLTTTVQVLMEETFNEQHYDVVIIDEASMMSVPTMAVLSLYAKEKLIIAGDYKQLGPIVISRSKEVKRVLEHNAFDAVLKGKTISEDISMLRVQHRMHEHICDVISKTFYANELQTVIKDENRNGANAKPFPGKALSFLEVTSEQGSETKTTDSYSRYNNLTAEICVKLASKLVRQPNMHIGVLTPYRIQAQIISRDIKKLVNTRRMLKPQAERIKVGTIHAFQGDESDIIIFDLVDTKQKGAGSLYQGKTGEFLINVGISRAKGKLVIVGDPDLFKEDPDDKYPLIKKLFDETPFQRMSYNDFLSM